MGFIDIPTEQTTAFTDLILSALAVITAVYIARRGGRRETFRKVIWFWAFQFLAIAAAVGAVAHGFEMPGSLNDGLWNIINFSLGMTIALFLVGTVRDLKGDELSRKFLYVMIAVSLIFFIVTVLVPDMFLVFIIYESIAMLCALVTYLFLFFRKSLPGSGLIAGAILITMIAAGIQATETLMITLIWEFDFNGIFHMVQMAALPFFATGISMGGVSSTGSEE
ncbi:MAG: hypothetical protein JXA22_03095 [Candidatus Thermoplasmatota archaeon]|nr:hypothetical protein [Candidatus Thermoplasmatota archaeon]